MNRGGQALLTYRVITESSGPDLLPGYVRGDIRVARYDGSWWSVYGAPLERNRDQPQRVPTAANSPQVGIAIDGSGIVAWQEPDDNFYDRIWARRIFGGTVGNVLEASPTTIPSGAPLNGNADGFALHVSDYTAAAVAIHQQPAADGKGFNRPRVFVNEIPQEFDPNAGAFEGARPIDGGATDGPIGNLGPVSIGSSQDGSFDAGFGVDAASFDAGGAEDHVNPPIRIDGGSSSIAGNPLVARGDGGGVDFAWQVNEGGSGGVRVLERDPDGTPSTRPLSSDAGGVVHALQLAGSDYGDAIVGFLQGDGANQTIDVASVNEPPGAFAVAAPGKWVNFKRVTLNWDFSPHGMTPVSYSVLVDDQDIVDGLGGLSYTLGQSVIPDGAHTIQVVATDTNGQTTDSGAAQLLIDRTPPKVTVQVSRGSRRVTVRANDGPTGEVSGLAGGSLTIRWGDGRRSSFGTRSFSHAYHKGGTYTVVVTVSDNAGNRARVTRSVRV
jgi:hypothetical protein